METPTARVNVVRTPPLSLCFLIRTLRNTWSEPSLRVVKTFKETDFESGIDSSGLIHQIDVGPLVRPNQRPCLLSTGPLRVLPE